MITISPQVFMWVVGSLVAALVALIGFIVNYILRSQAVAKKELEMAIYNMRADFHVYKNEMNASISSVVKEQSDIKFNYLKRFEVVNTNIHETKEEIIGKIHDLHTALIEKKN